MHKLGSRGVMSKVEIDSKNIILVKVYVFVVVAIEIFFCGLLQYIDELVSSILIFLFICFFIYLLVLIIKDYGREEIKVSRKSKIWLWLCYCFILLCTLVLLIAKQYIGAAVACYSYCFAALLSKISREHSIFDGKFIFRDPSFFGDWKVLVVAFIVTMIFWAVNASNYLISMGKYQIFEIINNSMILSIMTINVLVNLYYNKKHKNQNK